MYREFYGLHAKPFALTPDAEHLFLTPEQREAIASLMYAIVARRGMSVLIGDAGTGKTTLLRSLMRSIPDWRASFSVIVNPTLTPPELLRSCVSGFGVQIESLAKDAVLESFHRFLQRTAREKRVAVLVVDESQRLSPELLEEIRLLTNMDADREQLLQVVLSGQDELSDILDRDDMRQLKQRISTRVHIRPLAAGSVPAYIQFRWNRCSHEPVPFDDGATAAIARFSRGIPRLINIICENALILGFAESRRTIDAGLISAVALDLRLDAAGPVRRLPVPSQTQSQPAVSQTHCPESPLGLAHAWTSNGTHSTNGPPATPAAEHGKDARRGRWRSLFGFD